LNARWAWPSQVERKDHQLGKQPFVNS